VRRLPELAPALVRYIHAVHFHLAPLIFEKRLRRRVEARLAASINAQGAALPLLQMKACVLSATPARSICVRILRCYGHYSGVALLV
jgi:hypothetical protein